MGRAHARETHETKGGAAEDIFVVHDEVIAADLPAVTLSAPCEAAARVRERQRCAEPARRVHPAGAGLHAHLAAGAVARERAVHIGDARHGLHRRQRELMKIGAQQPCGRHRAAPLVTQIGIAQLTARRKRREPRLLRLGQGLRGARPGARVLDALSAVTHLQCVRTVRCPIDDSPLRRRSFLALTDAQPDAPRIELPTLRRALPLELRTSEGWEFDAERVGLRIGEREEGPPSEWRVVYRAADGAHALEVGYSRVRIEDALALARAAQALSEAE